MNKTFALGAGLAALLGVSSPAHAADMNEGLYVGDCGPKVQCSIELEAIKSGKSYRITYEAGVAHRVDSTFCKVSGIATLHKGKVLGGEFGPGKPFEILMKKGYVLSVGRTDNRPCGEPLKVNGIYEMVGD